MSLSPGQDPAVSDALDFASRTLTGRRDRLNKLIEAVVNQALQQYLLVGRKGPVGCEHVLMGSGLHYLWRNSYLLVESGQIISLDYDPYRTGYGARVGYDLGCRHGDIHSAGGH